MPTGWRNRWKVGDYLIVDDESGFTEYASDIVERWDGILFRRSGNEEEVPRHPQEFVRALNDPRPMMRVRPAEKVSAYGGGLDSGVVQGIRLPTGAATHLYPTNFGIGEMVVDGSANIVLTCAKAFVVR